MMIEMDEDEDMRTLVIDNGSHRCKAGYAGDSAPTAIVPTIVGLPFFQGVMTGMGQKSHYVGADAIRKRGILSLRYPIEHGVVTNWDNMERIWHHIFYNELREAPEEHPVLVTEPLMNPKANREKLTQTMFETFNVPLLYVARQPALALHSTGRSTGIVIDIGDGVTHFAPIYGNTTIPQAVLHLDMGGRDLTDYLMKLLTEKGHSLTTVDDREVARDIKEKHCYVALNTAEENAKRSYIKQSYKHSDGREFVIEEERFLCAEALFQPQVIGLGMPGLHECVYNAIRKCDPDIRKEMYSNIVLSGSSALLPGLAKRLTEELNAFIPITTNVNVVTPPNTNQAAWVGGSMLAASPHFYDMCISKEEYDESGPALAHKKFLNY